MALSRNLWIDPGEGSGFEIANDDVETDPYDFGGAVTVFTLAEAGIRGGRVLIFSLKPLTTCR